MHVSFHTREIFCTLKHQLLGEQGHFPLSFAGFDTGMERVSKESGGVKDPFAEQTEPPCLIPTLR